MEKTGYYAVLTSRENLVEKIKNRIDRWIELGHTVPDGWLEELREAEDSLYSWKLKELE